MYCKDPLSAEEILNLTYTRCWRKIHQFKGNSKFLSWANRISRNILFDEYRKKSKEKTCSLEGLSEGGVDGERNEESRFPSQEDAAPRIMELKELKVAITRTFDKLSEKHREPLELYLVEGMSYKEIAEQLECPLGTVMSRIFYGKREARKIYETLERKE